MKKYLLLVALSLTGCGTMLDAYLMKYDPNEYQLITNIRTNAALSKNSCSQADTSKVNADTIANQSTLFKNYVQYLPHNDKVISASVELDKMVQGLATQYHKGSVSPAFCRIKFESIEKSAESMQKAIGDKPR